MQNAVRDISTPRTLQRGHFVGEAWSGEEHCLGLVGQLIWSGQRSSRNKEILVSTMQKAGRQERTPER